MAATGHYHCSVKGVGRGTGASVMHKAAYRAGERLFDERSGAWTADYGNRARSVIEKFIMTRDAAAAWRGNRQRLWNAAEAAEDRSNGRIATEIELGLPHELSAAQRKELLTGFLAPIVNRHGAAADVAIHTAHDDRNIHAHVLLTHRELGPDGFGEIATSQHSARRGPMPSTAPMPWPELTSVSITAASRNAASRTCRQFISARKRRPWKGGNRVRATVATSTAKSRATTCTGARSGNCGRKGGG